MGMSLIPLVASFTMFALMEFGDKTHLAVISLSMKHKVREIYLGAVFAFALVDGVSVFLGGTLSDVLPIYWISIGSGVLFLALGVLNLFQKDKEKDAKPLMKDSLLAVFSLVAIMELGDKTQIASIVLAARYGSPFMVFAGIILASILIIGSGIILGQGLLRVMPQRYLRYFPRACSSSSVLCFCQRLCLE